jgi:hypothetical protein
MEKQELVAGMSLSLRWQPGKEGDYDLVLNNAARHITAARNFS